MTLKRHIGTIIGQETLQGKGVLGGVVTKFNRKVVCVLIYDCLWMGACFFKSLKTSEFSRGS